MDMQKFGLEMLPNTSDRVFPLHMKRFDRLLVSTSQARLFG